MMVLFDHSFFRRPQAVNSRADWQADTDWAVLHQDPPRARMVIRALPTEVPTTNVYCATCLRTRRFVVRPTHLVCETCSRRLDRVSPERISRTVR